MAPSSRKQTPRYCVTILRLRRSLKRGNVMARMFRQKWYKPSLFKTTSSSLLQIVQLLGTMLLCPMGSTPILMTPMRLTAHFFFGAQVGIIRLSSKLINSKFLRLLWRDLRSRSRVCYMQMIFAPSMSTHNKQGRGMAGGVESALHSTRFAT